MLDCKYAFEHTLFYLMKNVFFKIIYNGIQMYVYLISALLVSDRNKFASEFCINGNLMDGDS